MGEDGCVIKAGLQGQCGQVIKVWCKGEEVCSEKQAWTGIRRYLYNGKGGCGKLVGVKKQLCERRQCWC